MTEADQRRIFSVNLDRLVRTSGHTRKEVADALGFNYKTFNGWCNGISMPTMGKVQLIADYFHVGKTDLLDIRKSEITDGKPATIEISSEPTYEEMVQVYTRSKKNLSPSEKMRLAKLILEDEDDE